MEKPGLSAPGGILGRMSNDIPPGLGDAARFQAGVVSRQQALRSGLSRSAITSKVKCGRWRQVYPGVYATFSGPVGRDAQLWAAVLYAGKGAQLSHETAAEVNGLTERQSRLIHVSIPADRRVSPPNGVEIHLSAYLDVKARFPGGWCLIRSLRRP
jgi:predicted transcriptional regulator of viral defense system